MSQRSAERIGHRLGFLLRRELRLHRVLRSHGSSSMLSEHASVCERVLVRTRQRVRTCVCANMLALVRTREHASASEHASVCERVLVRTR